MENTNQQTKKEAVNNHILKWMASEDFYYEKTKTWFTIAAIVAIIFIAGAVLTKDSLLIITFVLAAIMFFIYETREPRETEITLNERGIEAKGKLYPYSEIESFWIFYDPPYNYISLKLKKTLSPLIKILLEDQNPVTIRHYLMEHIEEKEQKEGWIEIIERLLKI